MKTTQTVKNDPNYVGCDHYGSNMNHLVISVAKGVTANSNGSEYLCGNPVIIISRDCDTKVVYGFLAVATGTVKGEAGEFWPTYHKTNVPANGITPVTNIHEIPDELLGTLNISGIQVKNRKGVANYLKELG